MSRGLSDVRESGNREQVDDGDRSCKPGEGVDRLRIRDKWSRQMH